MKKVLIVIDMQNDFITGSLGTPEAVKIVPNVVNKMKEYIEDENMIYLTADTHFKNTYLQSREGKYLPVEHCIFGTEGWDIHPEIAKLCEKGNNLLLQKNTFSLTNWCNYDLADSVIEICGLVTDICVVSNALELRSEFPDAIIRVDSKCCAGTTPEMHKEALDVMKSCQIEVVE